MQKLGLYEKFANESSLLVKFKDYLINALDVPNCQQEVSSHVSQANMAVLDLYFHCNLHLNQSTVQH